MDELIYNQREIPREQWRYGLRSSAATGCGWIATYNALRLLGHPAEPESIIRDYERQLPLIHGNAGTLMFAPALYFRQRGFPTKLIASVDKFDEAAKAADVCILFYRWTGKLKIGAHFAALRYEDGGFTGYNTYRNSKGPDRYGPSLSAFLRKKKYFGCVLLCIKNKE